MNCVETKRILPSRYKHFMFIDTKDQIATGAFAMLNLDVKVTDVAYNDVDEYMIVFCDVRKKDVDLFKESMRVLENHMHICRKLDYESKCEQIFKELIGENYKEYDCLEDK